MFANDRAAGTRPTASQAAPTVATVHPPTPPAASTAGTQIPPRVRGDTPKRGWLRVGGENLVGARVETDGIFAGYAPLELSLPAGAHAIVVTSRSGHLVVRKHVHIGEAQTRLMPLRILR
jgi:hypothetical protein